MRAIAAMRAPRRWRSSATTRQPAGRRRDADTVAVGSSTASSAPPDAPGRARASCSPAGEARDAFKSLALAHADGKRWLLVGLGARAELTPERARVAAAVGARPRARARRRAALCWQAPADGGARGRRGARRGHDARRLPLRALQVGAADGRRRAPPSTCERADRRRRRASCARPSREAALVAERGQRARATCRTGPQRPHADRARRARAGARARDRRARRSRSRAASGIVARGMGAFAAVAQGSEQEPALITLRYEAAGASGPVLGLRRQGGHLRQRRHLAEARGEDGRDEVRHVRRRRRDRGDRGDRAAGAAGAGSSAVVGATENLPERARGQARRHRHRRQRQDDRGQQHRRRGPAGARRLPLPRRRARAPSGSSTSRR